MVRNIARMRRGFCFSAGSFTRRELYQTGEWAKKKGPLRGPAREITKKLPYRRPLAWARRGISTTALAADVSGGAMVVSTICTIVYAGMFSASLKKERRPTPES